MFQKFWTKLFEPRRWPESAIWPPSAAWPLQDTVHMREVHDQLQSSLFKHLSSELRNSVYQTALSDLDRFLHICANKLEEFEKQSRQRQRRGGRRVAHWRCTNRESPFPTWQHKCFGEEEISVPGKDSAIVERWVTTSDDMLISLLLSCRRVYSNSPQ
jgi:hypothetical protein